MKPLSIKGKLVVFLSIFGLSLAFKYGNAAFLFFSAISIVSAIAVDSFAIFIRDKKFLVSASSVITGLIIAFVLASDNHWWVAFACAVIAISSKYLFRFKNKHLFNPAGFGILFCTLFLSAQTQWLGTYLWYILAPAGLYFIYKIRKLEILFSYLIITLVLFGLQAIIRKEAITGIFGYLSYFYIFIMLIEPKTTPVKLWPKLIFGSSVGCLIFIFTQGGVSFDVEIGALLILNLMVPILNKIPERGKG